MDKTSFGYRIWQARRSLRLTQREAASKLNIDHCFLSKIENNRVDLRAAEYDKLVKTSAQVLEVELEELERLRSNWKERVENPNTPSIECSLDNGCRFKNLQQEKKL